MGPLNTAEKQHGPWSVRDHALGHEPRENGLLQFLMTVFCTVMKSNGNEVTCPRPLRGLEVVVRLPAGGGMGIGEGFRKHLI